MSSCLRFYYLP